VNFSWAGLLAFLHALVVAWRADKPLRHHDVQQVIFRQIYFTGAQAFRLVAISSVLLSAFTVTQSGAQLQRLGGADALGGLLVAAFLRELGPLVTLIVVVARSVSAVASELSSMKANGEIDGLRAAGVSPMSYLVVPRLLGGALSTMLLAMHFVWIAFAVGFFVAQGYIDMSFGRYVENILSMVAPVDLLVFFLKTFTLGLAVFFMACYCGLRTSGTSFEIPQATTKAVVWSFMVCFGMQALISGVYYLVILERAGWSSLL
jgi:phospholipid/cholesterol/gamma-HCH transport system permease protein